jgi:hypothetical protein
VTTAWTMGNAANPHPAAPALHHPAAATERLATAADIAGHADAAVHIPAPVAPGSSSSDSGTSSST